MLESRTVPSFIKTMTRITVRGIDGDAVASVLQSDSSIHDEPLSTSNPQIGVDEEDALFLLWWRRHGRLGWVVGSHSKAVVE